MGDRYFWDNKCEKCNAVSEATDQPSCLLYSDRCDNCGHSSMFKYVEEDRNTIALKKVGDCKCKYCSPLTSHL